MLTKIDWISFSIPVMPVADEVYCHAEIVRALDALHPTLTGLLGFDTGVENGNGRAPYRVSIRPAEAHDGVVAYAHPTLTHALIEVSGRGCDQLIAAGTIEAVIQAVSSRITRLDIACDILTEERPPAFAQQRNVKRFKATSHVNSESGETFYVGARSSNRYARVYRYNPPHERSAFLRVEHVIKQEDAKIVADALSTEGLASVVASLGQGFGWKHPEWKLDATPAEIAAYRPDRKEGKTLYWLADTIAPLLARLHNEGVIDVVDWLEDNVFPKLKD